MLPPGPAEPAALQTVEWIVRPTALLRRAQARFGEPFTLRTAYWDAPLVLVSDPEEIRRIFAAPGEVLAGGVGVAVAAGAVAGLYPALRAARLTPTEALRA